MNPVSALTPVGDDCTTRVRVSIPFDRRNSADLRQGLIAALDEGSGSILVDLSETTVNDQVGFTTLVAAHARAARAGRRLRFSGPDERTTRLLRRAGLVRLIDEEGRGGVARAETRRGSAGPDPVVRQEQPRLRVATG